MGRIFYAPLLGIALIASQAGAQSTYPAAPAGGGPLLQPAADPRISAPTPECVAPAPARGMTLAELESMALHGNPSLVVAAARLDAARGQWRQAGAYPNPSAGYLATEIGDEGHAGQQGGYVSQEFVLGGKLGLDRSAAAQRIDSLGLEWEAQRLRVVNDVRVGFYDVLVAQRRVELTDELLRIGQQSVNTSEQLLRGKEATIPDVLQAKVEANTARVATQNARNTHLGAWRKMAATCGIPGLPMARLDGQLEADLHLLTWDESINRILSSSPQVAASDASVRRAEYALERARKEVVPNLSVMVSGQYDNATGDPILGIQAGVPLPVWNRNQGGIFQAEADLVAARGTAQRVRMELAQRLAAVFERYANARQQVEAYTREILPDARKSLDMMGASYRAGEASYLMLLTVQRTYFQANLSFLDSLRELRESTVSIDGMLLSNSLAPSGGE